MTRKSLCMVRTLLAAYVVTGLLLAVLALLLYKFNLTQAKINTGIMAVYLISNLAGGFVIGKQLKEKKFIWGMCAGLLYFLLLTAVTLFVYRGIQGDTKEVVTTLFICMGGGMIGGMVS